MNMRCSLRSRTPGVLSILVSLFALPMASSVTLFGAAPAYAENPRTARMTARAVSNEQAAQVLLKKLRTVEAGIRDASLSSDCDSETKPDVRELQWEEAREAALSPDTRFVNCLFVADGLTVEERPSGKTTYEVSEVRLSEMKKLPAEVYGGSNIEILDFTARRSDERKEATRKPMSPEQKEQLKAALQKGFGALVDQKMDAFRCREILKSDAGIAMQSAKVLEAEKPKLRDNPWLTMDKYRASIREAGIERIEGFGTTINTTRRVGSAVIQPFVGIDVSDVSEAGTANSREGGVRGVLQELGVEPRYTMGVRIIFK
ncbi:MAG: hypothetical protein RBT63_10765 [Bdellovibrionales bacterium]|jgi:hypothetical protein|nr:hypothetical protein [Bdellovibrionales bacterium]